MRLQQAVYHTNCGADNGAHSNTRPGSALKLTQSCLHFATERVDRSGARIDRLKLRLRPDPGELPLGELSRRRQRTLAGLFQAALTVEVTPKLAIAHCPDRRMPRRHVAACAQGLDFGQKAGGHHLIETLTEPIAEGRPVTWDERPGAQRLSFERATRLRLPLRDGTAGCVINLERALDTLRIVWVNARRCPRVQAVELTMQHLPPFALGP